MDKYILILLIVKWAIIPMFAFKNFENAGYKWWLAFIPFYSYYIWLKVAQRPIWWIPLIAIPFLGFFVIMLLEVATAKAYGKFSLIKEGLAVIVPFIYLPYLGYSKSAVYQNPRPKQKKSALREWVDAIIYAVVSVSILKMYIFAAYTIPTSSMEKSLLVGDFLFVNKFVYGARSVITPISFPFVMHTMPLTSETKSYSDKIELKYHRYPALKKIKNYVPIVFNYPEGDTVSTKFQSNASYYSLVRQYGYQRVNLDKRNFGKIIYRPIDKRESYIKRCIGIPGDTLQVIDGYAYINGIKENHKGKLQFTYDVKTNGTRFRNSLFDELDITENIDYNPNNSVYTLTLTEEAYNKIKNNPIVESIVPNLQTKEDYYNQNCIKYLFPYNSNYMWTIDEYGPIYIPKKGDVLEINSTNICLYERLIETYEKNNLEIKGDKIYINDVLTDKYTVKMNYYWMMGDNRHNSADSRFWGFVPEDHIVGAPSFVWLSLNKNKNLFNGKVRWKKMFRVPK
ncbi:MAG: signal peptidase I [Bacteroidales bacterium]|jgi:signal peptidase I